MAKTPSGRYTKRALTEVLMSLFEENPTKDYTLADLARVLKLKTHPAKLLCADILEDMLADDYICLTTNRRYRLTRRTQDMVGIFRQERGVCSFLPDGEEKAFFVAERNTLRAMHGDRVRGMLLARRRHHVPEVQIIEIIERAKNRFVGELKVERNYAFLLTNDRNLGTDIFIPKGELKKGKTGDKAIVEIVEWPDDNRNPVGKVVDILGAKGDNDAEMHAILAEYDLPYTYPAACERAAKAIDERIGPEEVASREDFRDVLTFTIDPHDAKDFDDALSIRPLQDKGWWEVGVHIADVTHYIKEGSLIDKEGYNRATSVYLVDRTIPMLPERLCNYICSLRPDEEKLTYSVIFHLNDQGTIRHWHIARTVIRSDRRFTYEEVQAILEQNGDASPEDLLQPGEHPERVQPNADGTPVGDYAQELITLNHIAKAVRRERFKGGSISFDRAEVRFDTDDTGHPVRTYVKVAKDANKLVEEFMLLANRHVAEYIGKVERGQKAKPFVYRVHDVPDPEKLERLQAFVLKFGYKLRTDGSKDDITASFNKLLNDVIGKPEKDVVETVALRAMMKAKYSSHNIGHYGLMFRHYTHFTSPIRRYPDQMVHRLLTRYMQGGRAVNQDHLEDQCEHCSAMEQVAAQAERASIKYKQVEFMGDRLGEEFDGKISGLNEFGFYVELDDSHCEGMVPLRDLQDDYYEFDERNYQLVGRRQHHRYSLGDRVRIQVAAINIDRRQVDFALKARLPKP